MTRLFWLTGDGEEEEEGGGEEARACVDYPMAKDVCDQSYTL